jgi:acyl-CoA-binding protein
MMLPCEQQENTTRKFKTRGQMMVYVAVGAWAETELDGEAAWRALWREFFGRCVVSLDSSICLAQVDGSDSSDHVPLDDLRLDIVAIVAFLSDKPAPGADETLEQRFRRCEQQFAALHQSSQKKESLSNEVLLKFYAMFKQATVGDVNVKAPWRIDVVGRAKYDAWASLKGTLTKEEAMLKYCAMVEQL